MPKAAPVPPPKGRKDTKITKGKKKDPNAPKRGLSAYMFFANDQRDKVRADQPDLKFGEVGKVLGEKWKALSDAQKAPYEKKAAADKKRYEDEKAAYNASESETKSKSAMKSGSSGSGAYASPPVVPAEVPMQYQQPQQPQPQQHYQPHPPQQQPMYAQPTTAATAASYAHPQAFHPHMAPQQHQYNPQQQAYVQQQQQQGDPNRRSSDWMSYMPNTFSNFFRG